MSREQRDPCALQSEEIVLNPGRESGAVGPPVISRCSWPDRSAPASTVGKGFVTRVAPSLPRIGGFGFLFVPGFRLFQVLVDRLRGLVINTISRRERRRQFRFVIRFFRHPRFRQQGRLVRNSRTSSFRGLCTAYCRGHGTPHPRIAGQSRKGPWPGTGSIRLARPFPRSAFSQAGSHVTHTGATFENSGESFSTFACSAK